MADYTEAIRLQPSNPEAYQLRGNAYEAMGDRVRAKADFAMAKQSADLWGAGQKGAAVYGKEGLLGTTPSQEPQWDKWRENVLGQKGTERPSGGGSSSCK
jgi:hypothetical protein